MGDSIRVSAQAQCAPADLWHALVDNRAVWWPEMDFTASPGAPLTERPAEHPHGAGYDGGGGGGDDDDGGGFGGFGAGVGGGVPGAEQRATGTVLAVARDRLLSFRWTKPGWNAHTVVSFLLDAVPGPDAETDYTDVVITESGLGILTAGEEVARIHTEDWADHLAALIRLAENGARA